MLFSINSKFNKFLAVLLIFSLCFAFLAPAPVAHAEVVVSSLVVYSVIGISALVGGGILFQKTGAIDLPFVEKIASSFSSSDVDYVYRDGHKYVVTPPASTNSAVSSFVSENNISSDTVLSEQYSYVSSSGSETIDYYIDIDTSVQVPGADGRVTIKYYNNVTRSIVSGTSWAHKSSFSYWIDNVHVSGKQLLGTFHISNGYSSPSEVIGSFNSSGGTFSRQSVTATVPSSGLVSIPENDNQEYGIELPADFPDLETTTDEDLKDWIVSYANRTLGGTETVPLIVVIPADSPTPTPTPTPSPTPSAPPVFPIGDGTDPSTIEPVRPEPGTGWSNAEIGENLAGQTSLLKYIALAIGTTIGDFIHRLLHIDEGIESLGNYFSDLLTAITGTVSNTLDDIKQFLSTLVDSLSSLPQTLLQKLDSIGSKIDTFASNVSLWFVSLGTRITDKIDDLIDTVSSPPADPDVEISGDGTPDPDLPYGDVSSPFNFSGIWHYVTEWLSCISSFISMIQTVWSSLPYCMVVPVYACLTIIIVFGVLKKLIGL